MDVLDGEVLATLQDDVLEPAVIEEAIRLALAALEPAQTRDDRRRARSRRADSARARLRRDWRTAIAQAADRTAH